LLIDHAYRRDAGVSSGESITLAKVRVREFEISSPAPVVKNEKGRLLGGLSRFRVLKNLADFLCDCPLHCRALL